MYGHSSEGPTKDLLRRFGIVIGLILVVVFGGLFPWWMNSKYPLWPWFVAFLFWVPAVLYPRSLAPIYRAWMKLGEVFNKVVTVLVLGFTFYFMVLPIGLAMRLFRSDPLARSRQANAESYRTLSAPWVRDDMERPF